MDHSAFSSTIDDRLSTADSLNRKSKIENRKSD